MKDDEINKVHETVGEQVEEKSSNISENDGGLKTSEGSSEQPQFARKQWRPFRKQRRICYFCAAGIYYIDYKDVTLLSKYINSYCKIMPRRQTSCCNKHQGYLTNAIKRARVIGLLPFVKVE